MRTVFGVGSANDGATSIKGHVVVGPEYITVTGQQVTFTLTPDCAMVRSLNPPQPGNNTPASDRADHWKIPRPKERE
jgi:hypothetical protein